MRQDPMWAAKSKIYTIWPFTEKKKKSDSGKGRDRLSTPSTNSGRNVPRRHVHPSGVSVAREVGNP